uniref:Uncharacterized protein n=1 Tax=Avena sativa TaxID=4498 RepID=A0ACD5W7P2_AVESA
MAETVAIMAMRPLVSMLISKASSYLLDKYKVMEGMEKQLKILKRRLSAILDVIIDAEKQAMEHREGAKVWLQDLKTVAYGANEVFDELKYEALRREARKNGHYRKRDAIKLFPTHNRVVFRHRMGIKLCRILEDIEALLTDMQVFGFKYQRQPSLSKEERQTNHVIFNLQEIASRSRDKERSNIVDTLLRQANNADIVVVPIVGMGGLGKTTLAQLIYNEPNVQKHFQLPLWVCVSDTFDVNSLAKSIVEASPEKDKDTDKPPLDRLQKLVIGKRFLLVLDDVWNREVHKWEQLKVCLQHGGNGSAVLTTTRDKHVAQIMGEDRAYNLNVLEYSFIKEIIEARAFSSKKEKPAELVKMVGEIVERCRGSPLAATALGSVLRTKTSAKEWKAVLSRSSICTEDTGILPILKLSYNDLPSHMKQCFAFCAVFPKDYKINVDKLIQLWIANGFIPEHEEDSFETVGKQIFNELASRSFFLEIEEIKGHWNRNYSITTCKIHDLMHDIAISVMEKECLVATVKPSQTECLPDTTRHLYLSCGESEGILNDCMDKTSPAIQTLICDSEIKSHLKHPSKYSSLHALKLHGLTGSFVLKLKYLPQLRYLDLSNTCIKELPKDISILYNLQMLDLSNCRRLNRLPRQMKYMTSLCHIYTHGCQNLERMPPELGRLTKLQTLTCFVAADVAGPDCSDVAELQKLNLGGQLEICQVEKVREAEKKLGNLGNKKDLIELTLRWTSVCDTEVLKNFEPHDGLEVLRIYSYGGKCMGMLQNMVEIHLFHCERLQVLFRCGTSFTFRKLKQLTLEHMLDFERWWEINERKVGQIIFPVLEKLFIKYCGKLAALPEAPLLEQPYSDGYHSTFPALKVLEMVNLESLQRWDDAVRGEHILFPQLEKLLILKCPKLISLPEAQLLEQPCNGGYRSAFPVLKVLEMEALESFQKWDAVVGGEHILFPHLEMLSIKNCPNLMDLPEAPKLSVLGIENVKQELFHWVDRYLSSLTELTLKLENTETTSEAECTSVVTVDSREKWNQKSPLTFMELGCCNSFFGSGALEPWNHFVHLGVLKIDRCDVLVQWPEKVFNSLVSLKRFQIKHCNNLTGYTQGPVQPSASERSQHLPALEYLCLQGCANLVEMFNVPASLKDMSILLCSKLESIMGKQQLGMSELVQGSYCSEPIVPTAVSQLSSSPMNHFCPCLEYLWLYECGSLSGVLHLPPSLKYIEITRCSSIQVLSCQLDGLPKPEVTAFINAPGPSAATPAGEHSLPPCLTSLIIDSYAGMLGGILRLPTCLKTLMIVDNNGLTSLEPLSGGPLSLGFLCLYHCSTLASLPDEPQAYGSLCRLVVKDCPAIKKLPSCLQQRLGSIYNKNLDAQYEVLAFKPKTWKEIPRVVRQWRMDAKWRAWERRRAIEEQEAPAVHTGE